MPKIPVIAIVDDDPSIREALDDLVLSCGYESRLFASAEAFLADADRARIDCMLVDVRMPGLTGIELQAALNAQTAPKPPMIFMTSYRDERTKAAAMDGGAFAFLGKPVDFNQLVHCLEQALRH
ncbi:response regulator transcription factor [Rhizobium sp. SSA_523]|uniref:response regulator transcription factor n=1 Tax=Rhizobium sp. SSA_523 TaxID=2952477 RepID=UPI002090730D|nr:response regulator [Rhizobium sp. SSA_523]MCO5734220.1 response regulator [Rhizobium sp. SSA_523]WKC21501.1 response regulator [Rhizobium sp. SSA_523]